MKSQKITPLELSKEKPKHKKRKKNHSPKKANHKHEYYDVIVKVDYKNSTLYFLGRKCSICSNLSNDMKFFDGDGMLISQGVEEKYSHLEIVETDW